MSESIHFQQTCFHSSIGIHVEKMIFKLDRWLKWDFNIPPIADQQRISQLLSAWDDAIKTVDNLIENSQKNKKALLQQLLTGKIRLPGFNRPFQRKQIKDIAYVDKKSLGKNTPSDFRFKYISLSDVTKGSISKKLTEFSFECAPSRAKRIVTEGDILLATVRPNLQAFAKITDEYKGFIASTGFAVLTPKKGCNRDYLFHYLFGSHMAGQFNALVVGSNYPAINSSDVKGLAIYCPSESEQNAIAAILDKVDQSINVLSHKYDCLQNEKKALMHKLLTGRKRVNVNK